MTLFKNMSELKECVNYLKSYLEPYYDELSKNINFIEDSELPDIEQRHLCKVHIRKILIKKGISPLVVTDWLKEKKEDYKDSKLYSQQRVKRNES